MNEAQKAALANRLAYIAVAGIRHALRAARQIETVIEQLYAPDDSIDARELRETITNTLNTVTEHSALIVARYNEQEGHIGAALPGPDVQDQ